jgi:hypothetical protein
MERKDTFTKLLAITGTILIWLPFIAPVVFSIIRLVQSARFMFDYLLPAEIFFVALLGGALLIWAALRAKKWLKMVAWGLGISIALLLAAMGLASVTGLASGATEATGWQWVLVLGVLILCYLSMMVTGAGGILLIRDLYKK